MNLRINKIYLIFLSLIIMLVMPLGSDAGIGNMGMNCIFLAYPLAMGCFCSWICLNKTNRLRHRTLILVGMLFLVFAVSKSIYVTAKECYFDYGSRLKKIEQPKNRLANTLTTREKCKELNGLLKKLECYCHKGDYLLAYPCIPMINYLTETKPYLGTSWPWVYDSANLLRHFEMSRENIAILPVVVWNKSAIGYWNIFNRDWNNEDARDQWNFNSQKIKAMKDFMFTNNYSVVWENDLFLIALPDTNVTRVPIIQQ